MIYNYVFVGFNSHVKFDCTLFNIFLVIFVVFNVRVDCESLVNICEESEVRNWLATDSWVDNPQKVM